MEGSIYQKYGGFPVISSIVHNFYQKVREEETLDKYFSKVQWEVLMDHQTKFLCKVLGGPDNYTGRSLAASHQKLNITKEDFLLVGSLLQEALEEAGVEPADVATVMGVVLGVKDDIINRDLAG